MYHFPLGGASTPAALFMALSGFVEQARQTMRSVREELSTEPTEDSPWADVVNADWHLERSVVGNAGRIWGGRFAADLLAHAPAFPEQPTLAKMAEAMRSEGSPEQRAWMVRVATEAARVLDGDRCDPGSRSTSVSHNMREDFRRAFHVRLLAELPLSVKIEAMTEQERRAKEWRETLARERAEAEERRAREERERAEAERQRRRERRAARKSIEASLARVEEVRLRIARGDES